MHLANKPLGENTVPTSAASAVDGLNSLKAIYPELAVELIKAIEKMRKTEGAPLEDGLISEKRASVYLGISLRTLINWRGAKIIPHYKIGGRILYRRSEIDNAIRIKYRRALAGPADSLFPG